jgi:cell division protein FtsN
MLPLLLASALGIIIFSFNIFFVNYNKTDADYSLLIKSQNKNVRTDVARMNSSVAVPIAESKYQHKDSRLASVDLASPKLNLDKVKVETKRVNNVGAVAPAARIQSQRAEIKKTETVVHVSSRVKTQNWLIQAGAFSIEPSAVKIKNKIVPLGYNVKIVKTGTDKPLFKVMVSAGSSGAAPNDALKKLSSIGVDGYIIAGRP